MKKIIAFLISIFIWVNVQNNFVLAETTSSNVLNKDVILTLITNNINDAIVGYYGEYRDIHLYNAKILEIKRIGEDEFHFEIKVQVETEKKPSQIGLETITIEISPFRSVVTEFSHKTIQS